MRYLISLFLITIFLYIPVSQAAPVKWNISKFKIIQQSYDENRLSVDDEEKLQQKRDSGLIPGLKTTQIRKLEKYLEDVADEYQQLGFKEPQITNIAKNNKSYEIFFYDYSDKLAVAFYNRSEKSSKFEEYLGIKPTVLGSYLAVDSSRALNSNNKLVVKVYEDLAHELFHGIQQSYSNFKNNSNLGDWIVEGTATAVGEDIARQLGKLNTVNRWGGNKDSGSRVMRWGQRTYSNTLWVPDLEGEAKKIYPIQEGHRTKGFWRYIGEYTSTGGRASTKQVKPPNYKYLAKLFERPIYGKTNHRKELGWIDGFLRIPESRVGKGLGDIYPFFISTFAHYVPDRVASRKEDAVKAWQKCLFVSGIDCRVGGLSSIKIGCEKIELNDELTDSISSATAFSKVSARCFEVVYTGPAEKLDVQVYIESNNKKIINSIRTIGFQTNPQDGSEKIIRVVESTKGDFDDYPSMGLWELEGVDFIKKNRSRKKSVIFVVSNVAAIASQTYEGSAKVKLNFSYSVNTGNLEVSN